MRNYNCEEETIILTKHKISKFTKPISSLENEPRMGADELKAYFDSSPEELKSSLNSVVDELTSNNGANNIGFLATNRVPANNVQDAIENVQLQLNSIALGSVPDGSISKGKLATDVLSDFSNINNRFSDVENKINQTSSSLTAADNATKTNLQNQINSHSNSINTISSALSLKSEITFGKYKGTSKPSQFINTGFTPKAVLIATESGITSTTSSCQGGLAVLNAPCMKSNGNKVFEIASNGFICYNNANERIYCNDEYLTYLYFAIT